jgi:hypothetical protein
MGARSRLAILRLTVRPYVWEAIVNHLFSTRLTIRRDEVEARAC